MKAKVHAYSDSVLCLGKIHDPGEAIEQWKGQMTTFQVENSFSELLGLDGFPIDFEWTIVPGFTALQILHKIQSDLDGAHNELEEFIDRIIFMSMFNDIDLNKKGNEASCTLTSTKIQGYASNFVKGHWAFIGPGSEETWFRWYNYKPDGRWDSIASRMVKNFEETGHTCVQRNKRTGSSDHA